MSDTRIFLDVRFLATLVRCLRFIPFLGLLFAITLLSACAEREVILPGTREAISTSSMLGDSKSIDTNSDRNFSLDIRLPIQIANSEAAQNRGSRIFRTDNPKLSTNLNPIWSVNIGEGDSRRQRIVADPVVSGGRIFTLDALTLVSAVSTSGVLIWQQNILPAGADEKDATGGGLAVEGGVVYAASGFGTITALNASTGAKIWTQDVEGVGIGAPTVVGDLVYVIAGDTIGWALNKKNGRIQWQLIASVSGSNVLGAPAPIIADNLMVFAFGSGEIQAVFRRGGLRRWDASVLGERKGRALAKIGDITGQPIEANGIIYAGNQSGRLVAVNAGNGARIWSVSEGVIDRIVPVGGSLFLINDRNELLRLNALDGNRIWGVPLPNFIKNRPKKMASVFVNHGPILAGGRILVASSDGVIRSYDPTSGTLLGLTDITGGASTNPVVAGQTLYIVSSSGELVAFR